MPMSALKGPARGAIRRAAVALAAAVAMTAAAATATAADDGAGIARIDHYVKVKSTAPSMAGQDAMIYVREVVQAGPALRGGTALGVVLMVHGSGTPSEVGFDVPYADYSWAAYLAKAGFDVFVMDLEGYGRSTRPPAMADACNVPQALQPQFIPSVLKALCPPTFQGPITHIASDWTDIGAVVDHLRALRRVDKVNLVGWSQGGARVGGYAAQNPSKVNRIVGLAPNYLRERANTPRPSRPRPTARSGPSRGSSSRRTGIARSAAPTNTKRPLSIPSGRRCRRRTPSAPLGGPACAARPSCRCGGTARPWSRP